MRRSFLALSFVTFALAACGSSGESADATTGSGGSSAAGTGGSGGGATGTGGGGTGGMAKVGTYVVLGDSISDKGGGSPFFYDLLATNDDAKYPTWQGKDLKTKFGSELVVVSNAKGGAVSNGLPGQAKALPEVLAGPVVVTITIGGNDMSAALFKIIQGTDESSRENMRGNIKDALDELTKPGRFGAGVEVTVLQANIYDPTDGTGDFKGCAALGGIQGPKTDPIFANWNGVVAEEVPKHPGGVVSPLYETFYGHGIHATDTWFVKDCIHPNARGHHELRAMFWTAITGEAAPPL